tara:strand:- start:200 stop:520 length:321 start_codon:yes stop_codon:yes gene_type:complete
MAKIIGRVNLTGSRAELTKGRLANELVNDINQQVIHVKPNGNPFMTKVITVKSVGRKVRRHLTKLDKKGGMLTAVEGKASWFERLLESIILRLDKFIKNSLKITIV